MFIQKDASRLYASSEGSSLCSETLLTTHKINDVFLTEIHLLRPRVYVCFPLVFRGNFPRKENACESSKRGKAGLVRMFFS